MLLNLLEVSPSLPSSAPIQQLLWLCCTAYFNIWNFPGVFKNKTLASGPQQKSKVKASCYFPHLEAEINH